MILDTNALSAFVDGEPKVGAILGLQHGAAIPVIVLGEFRYGIIGSKHRKVYEEWLTTHLHYFDLLAITAETTVPYAALRATLKRLARPIPANDTWKKGGFAGLGSAGFCCVLKKRPTHE